MKKALKSLKFKLFTSRNVKQGVRDSVKKYGKTFKLLEKYDKGEVSKTKGMAEYRDLRKRIQRTKKTTGSK